jgi:glycosyltransferase involved in cell wall biosynthesis
MPAKFGISFKEVLKKLDKWPRISIVTPSYNQAMFIGETIESVLTQNYPNVEHIVIDGGSIDQTPQILKPYRHLKIISEPDRGQAEAINKGFRMATGKIWGYLNSDDTLLPNALHRIAQEIDPEQGRHIVMGRCRFVDERGLRMGIEHPSHFESHLRVLKVWKGHLIPQPAVFWTRGVWEQCGGMEENLKSQWIDYDLFCRFSKEYNFHYVDQVLATYRLHKNSKSEQSSTMDRLEEAIRISKRYWGSPLYPQFWCLALSLGLYRFNRVGRARHLFSEAKEAWRHGKWARTVMYAAPAGILAPEVAFYVAVYPVFKDRAIGLLKKAFAYLGQRESIHPQTGVYLDHTDPWEDNCVGPCLIVSRYAAKDTRALLIKGVVDLSYISQVFLLTVLVDGQEIGRRELNKNGNFVLRFALPKEIPPGLKNVEIRANSWYVPHHFLKNGDFRPLSWRMEQVDFVTD